MYEYVYDKLFYLDRFGVDFKKIKLFKRVYMIGDNLESDIFGVNGFSFVDGVEWKLVFVRIGVWVLIDMEFEFRYKLDVIVNDVVDVIVWVLNSEGIKMLREELLVLGIVDIVKVSEEEMLVEKVKEVVMMLLVLIGRIVV